MKSLNRGIPAFLGVLALIACTHSQSHLSTAANPGSVSAPNASPTPRSTMLTAHGMGCRSFEFPDRYGPPIYQFTDIGQPDAPKLSESDSKLIYRIESATASRFLSFVFADPYQSHLLVFDASEGRMRFTTPEKIHSGPVREWGTAQLPILGCRTEDNVRAVM